MVTLSRGTQWNGTLGRPNHPALLRSALLRQANQIPSRRSRWSISSSPFSRWDYLLRFKGSRVDVYCGSGLSAIRLRDADAELPAVSSYLRPPKKTYQLEGAAHDVPGVGTCNKHQILCCIWPLTPHDKYEEVQSWYIFSCAASH